MSSPAGPVYFRPADYVFLGIVLVGSMAIGLFFAVSGGSQKTKVEYLLGGRRMTALPVCLSLFATFQSAISLLGIPTEIYTYGTMNVYSALGLMISYILALFTTIPLMYPLKLTSVYEYLALRYQSRAMQLYGAVVGVICNLTYMTMALLSPALALETAVGIPLWLSIILVGSVGTIYTTLGGIKSVIWTDVFQTIIMYAGIFTVLVKGSMDSGGLERVWQIGKDTKRVNFGDTRTDLRVRHTVWNQSFGVIFYWLAIHYSQSSVQRVVSTRSQKEASKVYIFALPLLFVYNFVLTLTGLVLVAYFYTTRCDPLAAGYIKNKNQLMPYFVLHTLSFLPGFSGLYISTIFSGALSTLSSGINSNAANVVQDFLYRFLRHKSEYVVTTITKMCVCFFGMIIIGLAYLAKEFQGPVTQAGYTAIGASNGPLLGLFMLSGLFPQANYLGASVGFSTALVICFWQAIGSQMFGQPTKALEPGPIDRCFAYNFTNLMTTTAYSPDSFEMFNSTTSMYKAGVETLDIPNALQSDFSFYDLSYIWNPFIGTIVTIVIGLITSLITNRFLWEIPRAPARFIFPFCRRFWYDEKEADTEAELNDIH